MIIGLRSLDTPLIFVLQPTDIFTKDTQQLVSHLVRHGLHDSLLEPIHIRRSSAVLIATRMSTRRKHIRHCSTHVHDDLITLIAVHSSRLTSRCRVGKACTPGSNGRLFARRSVVPTPQFGERSLKPSFGSTAQVVPGHLANRA